MKNNLSNLILKKHLLAIGLLFLFVFFFLSCQKNDKSFEQEKASKVAEAKSYFESNAKTLKFFAFEGDDDHNTVLTKKVNEKRSNLVIDWDCARVVKTASVDIIEVPIKISSLLYGIIYDGFGNSQLNRKQIQVKTSLIIEVNDDGNNSHYLLTLCGVGKNSSQSEYSYAVDKSDFTGYEIFSDEAGKIFKVYGYENGVQRVSKLSHIHGSMIDSTGKDIHHKGLALRGTLGLQTKMGYIPENGEYQIFINCAECGTRNLSFNSHCSSCGAYLETYYGEERCPLCLQSLDNCFCCPNCDWFPCVCEQDLGPDNCQYCGLLGCTGQCLGTANPPDPGTTNNIGSVSLSIYPIGTGSASASYSWYSCSYMLSATANAGYTFAYWGNLNNEVVSTSNPYHLSTTAHVHLVAVFTQN